MKLINRVAAVLYLLLFFCSSCSTQDNWTNNSFYPVVVKAQLMYTHVGFSQANAYIDSAYAAENVQSPGASYMYYSFKTMYYINSKEMNKGLSYADSALALLEKEDRYKRFYTDYIHTLLDKGYILSVLGQHDEAYNCFLKAGMTADAKLDVCSRNEYHYQIAMSLYRQERYIQAARYFEKSFADADKCADRYKPYYRMQEVLANIGLSYSMRGLFDSACYYYDSTLVFIKKNIGKMGGERTMGMANAVLYKNKGYALGTMARYDTAEQLLLQSIRIASQPGYDSGVAVSARMILADVYYRAKQYDKMYSLLQVERKSMDVVPRPGLEWDWKKAIYQYYEGKGQFEQALYHYHDFIAYTDSMNKEQEKTKTDVVAELKDKQQQYQIAVLKKSTELDKLYLWITIGFSLLSVAIMVLVYQNYHKGKQKNKEISRQKDALERSNKEKDRILHVVAHDLRNPVGGIAYMADTMLIDDGSSLSSEDAFRMIKESSEESLSLVNELLGFSGDEKHNIHKEEADICTLIRKCASAFEYRAKEKKQELILQLPADPVLIFVDIKKINRLLDNLVSNAIKFSPEHTLITIYVTKTAASVQIIVKDRGIGIPPHLLPGLFEMFTESRRKGTANEKSYGLGLSISKQIIELHGGTIRVESEHGNGSSFIIELPY